MCKWAIKKMVHVNFLYLEPNSVLHIQNVEMIMNFFHTEFLPSGSSGNTASSSSGSCSVSALIACVY